MKAKAKFCLLLPAVWTGGGRLQAQAPAAGRVFTDCLSAKGAHPCDRAAFRDRFAAAHAVWVQEAPTEQASYHAVVKMLQAQGKVVEGSPTAKPQLMVLLLRTPSSGISIGPADQRLGQLLVFAYDWSKEGGSSELIWIENAYGQPDRPWPSVVTTLLDQFQERLKKDR